MEGIKISLKIYKLCIFLRVHHIFQLLKVEHVLTKFSTLILSKTLRKLDFKKLSVIDDNIGNLENGCFQNCLKVTSSFFLHEIESLSWYMFLKLQYQLFSD